MDVHSPEPAPSNKPWKILIIDDDEEEFILVRAMLAEAKGRKYIIEWASDFQTGREKLLTRRRGPTEIHINARIQMTPLPAITRQF